MAPLTPRPRSGTMYPFGERAGQQTHTIPQLLVDLKVLYFGMAGCALRRSDGIWEQLPGSTPYLG